jgi:hypothetical protein
VPIALAVCGESGSVALPDIVRCVEAVFVPKVEREKAGTQGVENTKQALAPMVRESSLFELRYITR